MCSQLLCWSQTLHHLARGRFTSKQKGYRDNIHPIHMYYSCHGASPKLSLLLAKQKAAFLYLLMRYSSRMTLPFSCIYFCFHSKAKYLETTTKVSRPTAPSSASLMPFFIRNKSISLILEYHTDKESGISSPMFKHIVPFCSLLFHQEVEI